MNAQSIFGSTVHRCLVDLTFRRFYRSERVFGYRAKDKRDYEVSQEILDARNRQSNLYRLAYAYRQHGHLKAHVDPVALSKPPIMLPDLDPRQYGLDDTDNVDFNGIIAADRSSGTVREAIELLERSYSKYMTAEFLYLESNEEIEWFATRMETLAQETLDANTRITIARELLKSQTFDTFLASKFVTVKRYGGEGAESMMAFFHELLRIATADRLEQIVLCMPHRGRLNLLTQTLNMRPAKLFRKLKGLPEFPEEYKFSGDVTSHLISSTDLTVDDKQIHLTLLYNPSHLEAVNPVSMGKTRAKQMFCGDGDYGPDKCRWSDKILNVQLHGDAAYSGQGINQESLALCGVPHFEIGGSIHLIVNNQLGFTTPASRGRSSRYCSDIAKSINAPVIHVNGIRPEEVLKAARLAIEYQRKFRKDVFVDMNCYRRWGHNELDDPTFTNPALYKIIESRKTIPDEYVDRLKEEGVLSDEDVNEIIQNHIKWLSSELESAENYQPSAPCFQRQWSGFEQAPDAVTTWDTGIDSEILTHIGTRSVTYPKDFCIHPRLLSNYVKPRLTRIAEGVNVDWATAEALAIGSLLYQGHNVRISGQDVGRGTFSHRHVMLVDQNTDLVHIPLNNLKYDGQGYLEVANSILSEEAVLAFEYGMSIESPDNLIIWEAQFGDFFNGAQIIIDTFISSGEAKWLTSSGLVMLLPHGYDGAGPEHSSCRMERFLQMTDSSEDTPDGESINMQVVNPTTAAQYFHLLRRQMVRNWRKPLVVISPKTLLRLPNANSDFKEMAPGTYFHPVIGDSSVHASVVNRVLFVSGKHYYALDAERKSQKSTNVAIIRLESLCPFPTLHLQDVIRKYSKAKDFVWCQEEHQNMGAWSYVQPRFEKLIGRKLKYIGRKPSAAPAVGIGSRHQAEVKEIITRPFLDKL